MVSIKTLHLLTYFSHTAICIWPLSNWFCICSRQGIPSGEAGRAGSLCRAFTPPQTVNAFFCLVGEDGLLRVCYMWHLPQEESGDLTLVQVSQWQACLLHGLWQRLLVSITQSSQQTEQYVYSNIDWRSDSEYSIKHDKPYSVSYLVESYQTMSVWRGDG